MKLHTQPGPGIGRLPALQFALPLDAFARLASGALLLLASYAIQAQTPNPQPPAPSAAATQAIPPATAAPVARALPTPTSSARRRAVKLFLNATRLFEKAQFEDALHDYQKAAALDPSNRDYALAAEVARSHAVTALVQDAAKDRNRWMSMLPWLPSRTPSNWTPRAPWLPSTCMS